MREGYFKNEQQLGSKIFYRSLFLCVWSVLMLWTVIIKLQVEEEEEDYFMSITTMEADELESGVPPGFRFHPTEEELVGYYLTRKINSMEIDLDVIVEIDLYKMEPWDIQGKCKLGGNEEQSEWYFFSHKDKKYPTGTRSNRATTAGFWKATGRDKAVLSKNRVIGMRKTLVFYQGRAPNGRKTDWIMHEYRQQNQEILHSTQTQKQDGEWVVCRAFKKPTPNQRQGYEAWNHAYYNKEYKANFVGSPSSSNQQHAYNLPLLPFVDNDQLQLPQLTTEDYQGICSTTQQHYIHNFANPIASRFALEVEANQESDTDHFLEYFHDS